MARTKRTVAADGSKAIGVVCCDRMFETAAEAEQHEAAHAGAPTYDKTPAELARGIRNADRAGDRRADREARKPRGAAGTQNRD